MWISIHDYFMTWQLVYTRVGIHGRARESFYDKSKSLDSLISHMTVYPFSHILLKLHSPSEGDYTRTWTPEFGISGDHHKGCLLNSAIRTVLCGMINTLKWGKWWDDKDSKVIGSCIEWDCVIVNNYINYMWNLLCLCFYVWWCLVHNCQSHFSFLFSPESQLLICSQLLFMIF